MITQWSFPSESCRPSASQEIPGLLRGPEVHYLVHNSSPLVHIPSQMNLFIYLFVVYGKTLSQ